MEGEEIAKEELPPGFRFHPTDEELITSYLLHKISDPNFSARALADVDLNKSEPWELPGKAKMGEKEWYFFSLRDRKYPTGVRTNRATNTGYWKTTGKDKEIFSSSSSSEMVLVGMKKTLVFYKGRAPRGEKTNWVMHEYRVHNNNKSVFRTTKQEEWVVCRVFQKSIGLKKFYSSSSTSTSNQQLSTSYNLEMGQTASTTYPTSENYNISQLVELNHLLPTMNINYPPGFTISGLNLNTTQQISRPISQQQQQSNMMSQQEMMTSYATEFNNTAAAIGHGNGNNTYMNMELDNYWPSY